MNTEELKKFMQGYACAVATMISLRGASSDTDEALRAGDISTVKDATDMQIDPSENDSIGAEFVISQILKEETEMLKASLSFARTALVDALRMDDDGSIKNDLVDSSEARRVFIKDTLFKLQLMKHYKNDSIYEEDDLCGECGGSGEFMFQDSGPCLKCKGSGIKNEK